MRGEDSLPMPRINVHAGSPPHARGRLNPWTVIERLLGITPACAGKTLYWGHNRVRVSDHPRMRGEDIPSLRSATIRFGSPPHARGRLGRFTPCLPKTGITPACAGKTLLPWFRRWS